MNICNYMKFSQSNTIISPYQEDNESLHSIGNNDDVSLRREIKPNSCKLHTDTDAKSL